MTDLRKAAEMAVKALERADKISGFPNNKNTLAALREALAAPVVPQDILDYTKGIYDFLQSVAPAGIADEAFRLPPNYTGNQRQISDFAAGDASGIVPTTTRPNQGLEGQAGRDLAAAPVVPEDTKRMNWLDQNIFHREIRDDWDKRLYPDSLMWVMFGPKGHQGTARNIIDAAMLAAAPKPKEQTT